MGDLAICGSEAMNAEVSVDVSEDVDMKGMTPGFNPSA